MIVAPNIPISVLRLVNRIAYPVELLEISRFTSGKNEFVLINPRQPDAIPSITVTKGQQVWDETWYRKNYNPSSVDAFIKTVHRIEKIIQDKGWRLETKYNKSYVSFKIWFPDRLGVSWLSSKSFCIFLKVPKAKADSIHIPGIDILRYEKEWNQVLYKVEGTDYPLEELMPLFEAAYQNISGNKS